jgi:hypothetical protein
MPISEATLNTAPTVIPRRGPIESASRPPGTELAIDVRKKADTAAPSCRSETAMSSRTSTMNAPNRKTGITVITVATVAAAITRTGAAGPSGLVVSSERRPGLRRDWEFIRM